MNNEEKICNDTMVDINTGGGQSLISSLISFLTTFFLVTGTKGSLCFESILVQDSTRNESSSLSFSFLQILGSSIVSSVPKGVAKF